MRHDADAGPDNTNAELPQLVGSGEFARQSRRSSFPQAGETTESARLTFDPYAELASLFLTDGPDVPYLMPHMIEQSAGAAQQSTGTSFALRLDESIEDSNVVTAPIEVAIVGHLPVMGGLWVTQYADQIARREGPTALVRLERGQLTLELLRAPQFRGRLEAAESLDEGLHVLAEAAARWVICPQGEAAVDGPLPAGALTLLTGADDAATVAAYRVMKNLAERWHIAGWPVPPVGLVVLGASDERVGEVMAKLDQATKAFLDVELSVAGTYQRMDAIESAGRRTFLLAESGPEPTLNDVCRRIRVASGRIRRAPRSAPASPPAELAMSGTRPELKLAPKPIGREVIGAKLATAGGTAAPGARITPLAREVHTAPRVAPAAIDRPTSLVSQIAGLDALPISCPAHRDVELAVDANGALHLVVAHSSMAALRPVEAWARAHADLLRLACGRVDCDTIVSHVVTTDAPAVVPLHGVGIRLHLIVQTVDGSVCVPLNQLT
ncbi:MAG: hypothetical protein SGJ11_12150 [Phycisphaerae bacterium]|nr:hypothetical protein [Phycisphaerae bacterium]